MPRQDAAREREEDRRGELAMHHGDGVDARPTQVAQGRRRAAGAEGRGQEDGLDRNQAHRVLRGAADPEEDQQLPKEEPSLRRPRQMGALQAIQQERRRSRTRDLQAGNRNAADSGRGGGSV